MYSGDIPQPREGKLPDLAKKLTKVRMTCDDVFY